ncbi:MAG TPA: efflux RND transporter periplasmic adaptor subunit [Candidatus Deferrimicrobiaceae bacterium]|jgi:membrane fusion protein (multidrug efflux system)
MGTLNRISPILTASLFLAAVAGLAGCGKQSSASKTPPPPSEVAFVTITPQRVALTTELPGRTSPYLVAEVRPQVGGIILKRRFIEGSNVKAGEVLYEIDPSSYLAAQANAKATHARAKAGLANARAMLTKAKTSQANAKAAVARAEANAVPLRLRADRFKDLVAINAVSRQDYDDAAAAVRQADAAIQGAQASLGGTEAEIEGAEASIKGAEADIQGAEAAMETARINLAYTRVTAPISGRIGKSAVTTGALVTANQPAPLATIQQLAPIYVDVTQSSANLIRIQRNLESGRMKRGGGRAAVKLLLEDGTPYALKGTLSFSDVTVDPGTGSVTVRTVFPNPKGVLLPGMYVRALVEEGVAERGILVPQRGVTRDSSGNATALVVGAGDKVEPRVIKVSRALGDNWLVDEGLKKGDRVIVEGLQRVRPGAPVKAVPFDGKSPAHK